MEKNRISSGWKIAILGGCAFVAVCGAAIFALMLVSALKSQAIEPPVYSESPPSYESVPQQEPDSAPQASIYPDLVGHWRYTDIFGSGDLTIVTDHHILFGSDGRVVSYSMDEDGQREDEGEGSWSATDAVITISNSDGTIESLGYQIVDGVLIFEGTSSQFWERIDP